MTLEAVAALLAGAGVFLSFYALDSLPSTMVPFFSPTRSALGMPGTRYEAEIWTWIVVALWVTSVGSSVLLYRLVGSSSIPVLSVGLFAFLTVLRAGTIALNLNPSLTPKLAIFRAVAAGAVAVLLAAALEKWRTSSRLRPALVARASYDERCPRGGYYFVLVSLLFPLLVLPSRVRVIPGKGLVVVTAVSFLLIPARALGQSSRAGWAEALFRSGVNLVTDPRRAVRVRRKGRLLPLILSVKDPPRFLDALEACAQDEPTVAM